MGSWKATAINIFCTSFSKNLYLLNLLKNPKNKNWNIIFTTKKGTIEDYYNPQNKKQIAHQNYIGKKKRKTKNKSFFLVSSAKFVSPLLMGCLGSNLTLYKFYPNFQLIGSNVCLSGSSWCVRMLCYKKEKSSKVLQDSHHDYQQTSKNVKEQNVVVQEDSTQRCSGLLCLLLDPRTNQIST